MTARDALRAWRKYWSNEHSDDLTLTGKQADELCRMLVDQPASAEGPSARVEQLEKQIVALGRTLTDISNVLREGLNATPRVMDPVEFVRDCLAEHKKIAAGDRRNAWPRPAAPPAPEKT